MPLRAWRRIDARRRVDVGSARVDVVDVIVITTRERKYQSTGQPLHTDTIDWGRCRGSGNFAHLDVRMRSKQAQIRGGGTDEYGLKVRSKVSWVTRKDDAHRGVGVSFSHDDS